MDVFKQTSVNGHMKWNEVPLLPRELIQRWNRIFAQSNQGWNSHTIHSRLCQSDRGLKLIEHRELISVVKDQLQMINFQCGKPTVFILTDAQGVVLATEGSLKVIQDLEAKNVGIGTDFSLNILGINAVSIAMEQQSISIVKGKEHHMEMFHDWSCVCAPIRAGGTIIGFLDVSFSVNKDNFLAIPLLEILVMSIERRYAVSRPELWSEYLNTQFDKYRLSPREKEVGVKWLLNKSTSHIGESLGIAEGTVRNFIKKIYVKTEVNSKGQLIQKFMY